MGRETAAGHYRTHDSEGAERPRRVANLPFQIFPRPDRGLKLRRSHQLRRQQVL